MRKIEDIFAPLIGGVIISFITLNNYSYGYYAPFPIPYTPLHEPLKFYAWSLGAVCIGLIIAKLAFMLKGSSLLNKYQFIFFLIGNIIATSIVILLYYLLY